MSFQVMGYWYFGSTWCSLYLALDILFCTSSIVHLCAISLDRYWSVTKAVSYNRKRTPKRIKAMISIVWLISIVISSPPLLMSQKEEGPAAVEGESAPQRQECLLISQTWYVLSSCLVSFFAPGIVMILVYCKIYRVAKQRASTVFVAKNVMERQPSQSETCFVAAGRTCRRSGIGKAQQVADGTRPANRSVEGEGGHGHGELDAIDLEERSWELDAKPTLATALGIPRRAAGSACEDPNKLKPPAPAPPPPSCISWASSDHSQHFLLPSPVPQRSRHSSLSRAKVAQMREKRFTFVLAVVMGVFVLCWFPFFFTYSLHAVCRDSCTIPDSLFNLFFWIGYCNSCLNPIIYTVFNRDFRRAFKKILFESHKRP